MLDLLTHLPSEISTLYSANYNYPMSVSDTFRPLPTVISFGNDTFKTIDTVRVRPGLHSFGFELTRALPQNTKACFDVLPRTVSSLWICNATYGRADMGNYVNTWANIWPPNLKHLKFDDTPLCPQQLATILPDTLEELDICVLYSGNESSNDIAGLAERLRSMEHLRVLLLRFVQNDAANEEGFSLIDYLRDPITLHPLRLVTLNVTFGFGKVSHADQRDICKILAPTLRELIIMLPGPITNKLPWICYLHLLSNLRKFDMLVFRRGYGMIPCIDVSLLPKSLESFIVQLFSEEYRKPLPGIVWKNLDNWPCQQLKVFKLKYSWYSIYNAHDVDTTGVVISLPKTIRRLTLVGATVSLSQLHEIQLPVLERLCIEIVDDKQQPVFPNAVLLNEVLPPTLTSLRIYGGKTYFHVFGDVAKDVARVLRLEKLTVGCHNANNDYTANVITAQYYSRANDMSQRNVIRQLHTNEDEVFYICSYWMYTHQGIVAITLIVVLILVALFKYLL